MNARMDTAGRSLVFEVAGEAYAASLEWIEEVESAPALTRAPLAREWILGVMNLRGALTPVLDARRLMGRLPSSDPIGHAVAFRAKGVVAALAVDSVAGIVALGEDSRLRMAESSRGPYVRSAHAVDGRVIRLMDLERLVTDLTRRG